MRRGGRRRRGWRSCRPRSRTGCAWRILWRFQAREIGDAQLTAEDEDAQLEAEKRVLANAEKLYTAAMSAHDLLYESEGAAETTLAAALKQVEELARYEPRFAEAAQQLAAAKAAVEDVSAGVQGFCGEGACFAGAAGGD